MTHISEADIAFLVNGAKNTHQESLKVVSDLIQEVAVEKEEYTARIKESVLMRLLTAAVKLHQENASLRKDLKAARFDSRAARYDALAADQKAMDIIAGKEEEYSSRLNGLQKVNKLLRKDLDLAQEAIVIHTEEYLRLRDVIKRAELRLEACS